jgi:RNA polymerase sigma-70 factor (ECF subfamily)
VQPHESALRGYLRARFHTLVIDIDDLVQETFLRVWLAQARREIPSPKALLFTTARNLAIDSFRRHTASRVVDITRDQACQVADESPHAAEAMARRHEIERLLVAIDQLSPRHRDVLRLHRIEGLKQREIAVILGVSLRTVETDLRRALDQCGKLLGQVAISCGRRRGSS